MAKRVHFGLGLGTEWDVCVLLHSSEILTEHRGVSVSSPMANVTVSVPEELKKKMEHIGSVNWSEVARQAFEDMIRRREMLEAAQDINRLRVATKTPGWSGAHEIRKWRDAGRKS